MANRLKSLFTEDKTLLREFYGKSGTKYIIRRPDEVFSFIRLNEFHKWSLILQHGKAHQEQYNELSRAIKLCDKAAIGQGFTELAAHLLNMRDGLMEIINRKYDAASLLCTLFIVSEDEDITRWSQSEGIEKIKDWAEYSPFDFFLLGMHSSKELKSLFQKMPESLEAEALKSWADIS